MKELKDIKDHPDNISPVQVLQNRLNVIDRYIARLERNSDTTTDFFKFYKSKSIEFQNAIKKLIE